MENDAVRIHGDQEIVEEIGKENEKSKKLQESLDENDDNYVSTPTENIKSTEKRKPTAFCCCCNQNDMEKDDDSLEPAGSTALYHQQVEQTESRKLNGFALEMRSFLNSPVYYIFVIIVSFTLSILLLVELFIDAGLFHVDDTKTIRRTPVQDDETNNVSKALHWFSFALLAIFFMEVIMRAVVWGFALARDFVSIFDCIVVFVAFSSNLCVTLIAGPDSPIDGISLIIICRLIRIHTLIKVKVKMVKRRYEFQIQENERKLYSANCKIITQQRQIKEKDYEVKQLQAYLGGGDLSGDPQLIEAMKSSMNNDEQSTQGAAAADTDLQMAIALSKQMFDEVGGGVSNRAFTFANEKKLSNEYVSEEDLTVLVHERPNNLNSQDSEVDFNAKLNNYMDDDLIKPLQSLISDSSSPKAGSGAIRKKKNLSTVANSNSNNKNDLNNLNMLENSVHEINTEPVTICINPNILHCIENEKPMVEKLQDDWSDSHLCDTPSNNSDLNSSLHDLARSTVSSPHSEIGSSDDCTLDSVVTNDDTNVNLRTKVHKIGDKNSGSSLSSESGYLSEEFGSVGGKKLSTVPVNGSIYKNDIELDVL